MVMQLTSFKTADKPLIAILLGGLFTPQNYARTGVPYLKEVFEVVVLDCNPWLRVGYSNLRFTKHEYPRVVTIASANDFEAVVGQLKPDYAIDFIGYGAATYFIQKTLRTHGAKFVVQKTGTLPVSSMRKRTKAHLARGVENPYRFLQKATVKLVNYLKRRFALAPDVALLAGRKSLDAYAARARNILWIASNDYYVYKHVEAGFEHQTKNILVRGKYALFIDDCIVSANDHTLLGVPPPMEPDAYYVLLRRAFDRFEHITGMKVVVAAHPNGKDIESYASFFGKRQIHFDMTAELCAQSDLVLSHHSAALSYAVLWEKPLIILTSESLDKSYQGAPIRERSIQLDCPLLFVEADDCEYMSACKQSKTVSVEAYRRYINNYIKSDEVAESGPWQAFTNFVNQNRPSISP